jgi:hypothetical protein
MGHSFRRHARKIIEKGCKRHNFGANVGPQLGESRQQVSHPAWDEVQRVNIAHQVPEAAEFVKRIGTRHLHMIDL